MAKAMKIVCIAAVLTLLCMTKASSVGTVELAVSDYGAGGAVKIWGGGRSGLYGYGGVYMVDKTNGTNEGNIWSDGLLGVMCMDLPEAASRDIAIYDVIAPKDGPVPVSFLGGPMGTTKADYVRELWGRYFDHSWVGTGLFTQQQKNDSEAFNIALWEIIYEDFPTSSAGWDVTVDGTDGDLGFRCELADTITANNWLNSLDGTGPMADLRSFAHDGNQDFLIEVPEPMTVTILGLAGLVLVRKRDTTG